MEIKSQMLDVKELTSLHNRTHEEIATEMALNPLIRGAATNVNYTRTEPAPNLTEAVKLLASQVQAINKGDLSQATNILVSQANTLDAIFNDLAMHAIRCERLEHRERYLRLAFKAQAQCARTLETLAVIKNPPKVAFVKQANIGQATQINNAISQHNGDIAITHQSKTLPHENIFLQNELLEQVNGQRLDTRTQAKTSIPN